MNSLLSISSQAVKRREQPDSRTAARDDVELFGRFLDGDDNAFMELFDRHTPRLGKYCRKMIGDRVQVEDLMQDLWEKVIRLRDKPADLPYNPLGLLYWMTRNLCLNHLRGVRRHPEWEGITDLTHAIAETEEMSSMEEMVVVALEKLPLSQREVLILNAYSGYTFEEIAQMTGESHGAVRTRAWRARTQLKRIVAALIELEDNRTENEGRTSQSNSEDEQ